VLIQSVSYPNIYPASRRCLGEALPVVHDFSVPDTSIARRANPASPCNLYGNGKARPERENLLTAGYQGSKNPFK
jgi:hypothetical protein